MEYHKGLIFVELNFRLILSTYSDVQAKFPGFYFEGSTHVQLYGKGFYFSN